MKSKPTSIPINQIIRSKRKTIAIIVQSDGSLMVRAPLRATDRQIHALVDQKADWVRAKQAIAIANKPELPVRRFLDGEEFLFLGKTYPLKIVTGGQSLLTLNGAFELERAALPKAEQVFTHWYQEQARKVLTERVEWYAGKHGFQYRQIKITSARTRWGSCNAKGVLCFTWRLVMAALPAIDYVVVHELAHTVERNHGKDFWKQVEAILPDYKTKREWLRVNGRLMILT